MKLLKPALIASALFFVDISTAFAVTITNPLGEGSTVAGIIGRIVAFVLQAGIAVSVIVFLWGGFQYLTSFGDEKKVSSAKSTLWWGVVGIIVLLLAQGLTAFIKNVLGA